MISQHRAAHFCARFFVPFAPGTQEKNVLPSIPDFWNVLGFHLAGGNIFHSTAKKAQQNSSPQTNRDTLRVWKAGYRAWTLLYRS